MKRPFELRIGALVSLALAAGCHGGKHGSSSFTQAPIAPDNILSAAYFEQVPQYSTSGLVRFYEGDVQGCNSTPRCGYTGATLYLHRTVDGGMLPLVAGDYAVVAQATRDAGPGVELREALLQAFTISASSKGGSESPGPHTSSEIGCNNYPFSVGDGGTVTVGGLDGGVFTGSIDATMVAPAYNYGGPPVYTGPWRGSFAAQDCP